MSGAATVDGEAAAGPESGAEDDAPGTDDGGAAAAESALAVAPTPAEPTRAPPTLSMGVATGLGALAAAFLAAGSPTAGATAVLAVALLLASLLAVSRRLCRLGGAGFVAAFVAGGVTAAPAAPLVAGAILAVAAWDVTDHALGLADHVGREARTVRNELVHTTVSLAVGGAAGAVAFGGFLVAGGNQPVTALVFLLFGGVLLLAALRR